jgi:hypothetical protein
LWKKHIIQGIADDESDNDKAYSPSESSGSDSDSAESVDETLPEPKRLRQQSSKSPPPRPKLKRKRVIKVNVERKQCPVENCEVLFRSARSAHRHLKESHKLNKNHELIKNFKMDRFELCTICSKKLTGSNRSQHEKRAHPALFAKRLAAEAATLQDGVSPPPPAPVADVRDLFENGDLIDPLLALDTVNLVEAALKPWQEHMVSVDSPSALTQRKYFNGMRAFLIWFIKNQSQTWDPTVLCPKNFDRPVGPIPILPDLRIYESSVPPSTLKTTIAAYHSFHNFLSQELTKHQLTMQNPRYTQIASDLLLKQISAKLLAKSNSKKVARGANKNRFKSVKNNDWTNRPDEVFQLMSKFSTCKAVETMLDEMPNEVPSSRWTKFEMRDFLMACLLVLGGGHRGEVVRNLTLEEFCEAKRKNDVWVALVFKHKTGSEAPAYLTFFDDRLFSCMNAFLKHVRPEFVRMSDPPGDPEDGTLQFFLNEQGGYIDRNLNATEFFKKQILSMGLQTKEQLKGLTGKCFRSTISAWGSSHQTEGIRTHIASLQVGFTSH